MTNETFEQLLTQLQKDLDTAKKDLETTRIKVQELSEAKIAESSGKLARRETWLMIAGISGPIVALFGLLIGYKSYTDIPEKVSTAVDDAVKNEVESKVSTAINEHVDNEKGNLRDLLTFATEQSFDAKKTVTDNVAEIKKTRDEAKELAGTPLKALVESFLVQEYGIIFEKGGLTLIEGEGGTRSVRIRPSSIAMMVSDKPRINLVNGEGLGAMYMYDLDTSASPDCERVRIRVADQGSGSADLRLRRREDTSIEETRQILLQIHADGNTDNVRFPKDPHQPGTPPDPEPMNTTPAMP